MVDPNHSQLIPGVCEGGRSIWSARSFKLCMKPAECKLHKNLSTVCDHGVAAFQKLFRELKYLLCTVISTLLWTIFCEFYYDCRLWMSLLWSLPSSLVNQVYFFHLSPSIHPPGIAVTLPRDYRQ